MKIIKVLSCLSPFRRKSLIVPAACVNGYPAGVVYGYRSTGDAMISVIHSYLIRGELTLEQVDERIQTQRYPYQTVLYYVRIFNEEYGRHNQQMAMRASYLMAFCIRKIIEEQQ